MNDMNLKDLKSIILQRLSIICRDFDLSESKPKSCMYNLASVMPLPFPNKYALKVREKNR